MFSRPAWRRRNLDRVRVILIRDREIVTWTIFPRLLFDRALQRLDRFLEGQPVGSQKVCSGAAAVPNDCSQHDGAVYGVATPARGGSGSLKNLPQLV